MYIYSIYAVQYRVLDKRFIKIIETLTCTDHLLECLYPANYNEKGFAIFNYKQLHNSNSKYAIYFRLARKCCKFSNFQYIRKSLLCVCLFYY